MSQEKVYLELPPFTGRNVPIIEIAKAMHKDAQYVRVGLQQQDCDLPPFPVDCLPAVMKDYVEAVAVHSQTSADMAAVIGIGVLAVCLQGKFLVQGTPGYEEPLSLYTVVIAAPGERKSSVMREMTKYLYDYEKDYNETHEPEIRKNRQERESLERRIEGLQDKLRKAGDDETEAELSYLESELEALIESYSTRKTLETQVFQGFFMPENL